MRLLLALACCCCGVRGQGGCAAWSVATLVGGGATGNASGTADGVGTSALFSVVRGVAVGAPNGASRGDVYVTQGWRAVAVRAVVVATRSVSTLTGLGTQSFPFADGVGTSANFSSARALGTGTGAPGTLYVADGSTLRALALDSARVTTLAGGGLTGTESGYANGQGTNALFSPAGMICPAVDPRTGALAVGDYTRVRAVTPAGAVTLLAGGGVDGTSLGAADGTGTAALFWAISGAAFSPTGEHLYIAEMFTLRVVDSASLAVTTLAGNSRTRGSTNGFGTAASFSGLSGLAVDTLGMIFSLDFVASNVRLITPAGQVSTLAGGGALGNETGNADGAGTAALFDWPQSIAVGAGGVLYVPDNDKVRTVTCQCAAGLYAAPATAAVTHAVCLACPPGSTSPQGSTTKAGCVASPLPSPSPAPAAAAAAASQNDVYLIACGIGGGLAGLFLVITAAAFACKQRATAAKALAAAPALQAAAAAV